jgi:hypothetical protein
MSERDPMSVPGLTLSEAIGLLRDELLLSARAAEAGADIQLPVASVTMELSVTATRSVDGKTVFTVPVEDVQPGGAGSSELGPQQKVTVVFGRPVDADGLPVKVASSAIEDWDRRRG